MTGVRDLQGILDRCILNAETGCWHWTGAMSVRDGKYRTPHVQLGAGVIGPQKVSTTATKAAWLLSGRKLQNGHGVWRTCGHDDCCNPQHMLAGTRKDRGKWQRQSGHMRGDPVRAATAKRAAKKRVVPAEKVSMVLELVERGASANDICAAVGLHYGTVSKIRNGKHVSQQAPTVGVASVFAWRPAA